MTNPNQAEGVEVKLVGLTGPYRGNSYILRRDDFLIGRIANSDLVLVENTISAQHAKIVKIGGRYEIQDLSSTNGTYVNGIKVDRKQLRTGDKIKFDQAEFEFVHPFDASRTVMASAEALASLGQTIARAPQPAPYPMPAPTPAPASVPAASPAQASAPAGTGRLLGGSILGVIIGLLLADVVYFITALIQMQSQSLGGISAENIAGLLRRWVGVFPGFYTHVGWKATGLMTVTGVVIFVSLLAAPIAGGLVARAVGKRAPAKTAAAFSLLYVLAAVIFQLAAIGFKIDLWPTLFPPLLVSLGAWGNAVVGLVYFWGVVFVLSFVGACFVRPRAD